MLKIVGDLLTIYNKDGNKRLQLGNVGGKFTLNIYNDDGKKLKIKLGDYGDTYAFAIYGNDKKPAIYMDASGEVIIAGSIQTMKDCLIQGMLRVGISGNNTKGIEFYGDSYQPDKDGNYSTPYARLVPYVANNEDYKGINVEGGEFCVNESPVATKKNIEDISKEIQQLTEKVNNLKKQIDTMS